MYLFLAIRGIRGMCAIEALCQAYSIEIKLYTNIQEWKRLFRVQNGRINCALSLCVAFI